MGTVGTVRSAQGRAPTVPTVQYPPYPPYPLYRTHKNGNPYLPVLDLQKTCFSLLLKLDKLHTTTATATSTIATTPNTTTTTTTTTTLQLQLQLQLQQLQLQPQLQLELRYSYNYNYNYHCTTTTTTTTTHNYTTPHHTTPHHTTFSSCGWVVDHRNLQKAQPKPFGPSVESLCHPCVTTTHLYYSCLSLKLPPPPCAVLLVWMKFFKLSAKHWPQGWKIHRPLPLARGSASEKQVLAAWLCESIKAALRARGFNKCQLGPRMALHGPNLAQDSLNMPQVALHASTSAILARKSKKTCFTMFFGRFGPHPGLKLAHPTELPHGCHSPNIVQHPTSPPHSSTYPPHGPKWPNMAHHGPTWPQYTPNMPPTWPQHDPNMPPRWPKIAEDSPQHGLTPPPSLASGRLSGVSPKIGKEEGRADFNESKEKKPSKIQKR